jgi:exosortase
VLCLLLHIPSLLWLFGYWADNLDHFIGVIAPLVSIALVWLRLDALRALPISHDPRGLWLLVPALLLHLTALGSSMPLLSGLALPMMLHGLSLWVFGPARTRLLLFPIWFLLFAYPFLDGIEIYLSFPMRLASTMIAQGLLMPFMELSREGANLITPNLEVAVVPACSGLNYLSTLLLIGVFYTWMTESSLPGRITLLLLIWPIVLVANGLRIAVVAILGNWFGRDVALGFFHDFSGISVFVFAVLGLVLAGMMTQRLFPDPEGLETSARPRSDADRNHT